MKTLSIAMATYNGAGYIAEQLESFARQTMLPSELVITDDGSTDATLDIVAGFAAKSPFPVRVEKNEKQLGFRGNFMKAASLCKSDFIAFSDQDDVWLPQKLETCLRFFDGACGEDVFLVYHNATVVNNALEPTGSLDREAAPQSLNPPQFIDPLRFGLGFTQIVRRDLVVFNDLWPQSKNFYHSDKLEAHDQWFFFLASVLGTIGYIAEPMALYRQHGGNVVGFKDASGIRKKWENLVATDMAGLKSREDSARARAAILAQAKGRMKGRDALIDRGIAGYRKLEAHYRLRQEMYKAGNPLSRLLRIIGLLRSGGYRPRLQWGVGRQALLRDIWCGVFFPPKPSEKPGELEYVRH